MKDVIEAIWLGMIQGATEFLPVSSTGHLVLARSVLGIDPDKFGLSFDVALHLGTLLAVLFYFRRLLLALTVGWLGTIRHRSWRASNNGQLAWLVILGSIPAGIAGFLFESSIESAFRSPEAVEIALIAFSAPMAIAELTASQSRVLSTTRLGDAIVVGGLQALALIPGVSRSGITIAGGLMRGLERRDATSFAFILGIPVIAAASLKHGLDLAQNGAGEGNAGVLVILSGVAAAAIVGYGAIEFLIRYLRLNSLYPFVFYRLVLGALVLVLV